MRIDGYLIYKEIADVTRPIVTSCRMEGSLVRQDRKREPRWTERIAVGSEAFVEKTKAELGIKAMGREVMGADGVYELREGDVSYSANFGGENSGLRPKNTYFWSLSV